MESASRRVISLVVAALVLGAALASGTGVQNPGFESGTGSVPDDWSKTGGSLGFHGQGTSSNGRRVNALVDLAPPEGSWMAYADTSLTSFPTEFSGLISSPAIVDGTTLTFVADFLTNERNPSPDPSGVYNDDFSLVLRSTGTGAPADRTIKLADTYGTSLGAAGGFQHHTGFVTYSIDVSDRVGFSTTLQFHVRDDREGQVTSAFLLDSVRFVSAAAPVADAGPDQVVECAGTSTSVTLDGSASTGSGTLTYTWTGDFEGGTATGANPTVTFADGLGLHTVTLVVNDGVADSAPDTALVTIVDTTPPELTVTDLPESIWPPNHKLVLLTPTVTVTDACDPLPTVTVEVTSTEAGRGLSDADVARDIVVHSATDIQVRAERFAKSGRTYTLVWTARDASGNTSTATATVLVPHSQGH